MDNTGHNFLSLIEWPEIKYQIHTYLITYKNFLSKHKSSIASSVSLAQDLVIIFPARPNADSHATDVGTMFLRISSFVKLSPFWLVVSNK